MVYVMNKDIIDRPSLVIIIDCWKKWNFDSFNSMVRNIKTWCETDSNIETVIVSTYLDQIKNRVCIENPWWNNSKNIFFDTTRWEKLRDLWLSTSFVNESHTHHDILTMKPQPRQLMLSAWDELQLIYYCNYVNPSIENVYIVGQSWNVCLEGRPLGWTRLHYANQHNLFRRPIRIMSKLGCVITTSGGQVDDPGPDWHLVDNDIVMYEKKEQL